MIPYEQHYAIESVGFKVLSDYHKNMAENNKPNNTIGAIYE